MSTAQVAKLDMEKLNAFIGQFVTDLGAAVHTGMVVIGEKLGLYKALAAGPMSSAELAGKTQTDERYLREWLASQAAGGYLTYDAKTHKFSLTEESLDRRRCRSNRSLRNGMIGTAAAESSVFGSFTMPFQSERPICISLS